MVGKVVQVALGLAGTLFIAAVEHWLNEKKIKPEEAPKAPIFPPSLRREMCLTMNHSYPVMNDEERKGLERQMDQLWIHNIGPFVVDVYQRAKKGE